MKFEYSGLPGILPEGFSDVVTFTDKVSVLQHGIELGTYFETESLFYSVLDKINKEKKQVQVVFNKMYTIVGFFDNNFDLNHLMAAMFIYLVRENLPNVQVRIKDAAIEKVPESSKYKITFKIYEIAKTVINYLSYPDCKFSKSDTDLIKLSFTCNKDILNGAPDLTTTPFNIYSPLMPEISVSEIKSEPILNGRNEKITTYSQLFETYLCRVYLSLSDAITLQKIYDKCECNLSIENLPQIPQKYQLGVYVEFTENNTINIRLAGEVIASFDVTTGQDYHEVVSEILAHDFSGDGFTTELSTLYDSIIFFTRTDMTDVVLTCNEMIANISLVNNSQVGYNSLQPITIKEIVNNDIIDLKAFDITFYKENLTYSKYGTF